MKHLKKVLITMALATILTSCSSQENHEETTETNPPTETPISTETTLGDDLDEMGDDIKDTSEDILHDVEDTTDDMTNTVD